MSASIDRLRQRQQSDYWDAIDVLGDFDVSSFVPFLSVLSSVTGGAKKPDDAAALKKMMEEKAKADAEARQRTLVYGTLGVLGATVLGTVVYLIAKK